MIHFLVILLIGLVPTKLQAHEDSVTIYNAYTDNIKVLTDITDHQKWYGIQDSLDKLTACCFRRLSLYNGKVYHPLKEYNKEGFGVAYFYPQPVDTLKQTYFSVIDLQTKFILRDDGKTKIPYNERWYFGEDHSLVKIEKLDPVTLDPLKPEDTSQFLSLNN